MRVVAGKKKGQRLKAVPGSSTRPTSDKVKEAIFNMIGPFFEGGIALDLFAGSGGLGIEALSRGIDRAIFVDKDKKACETIQENIAQCKLDDRVELYRNDALRALRVLSKRGMKFSIIFLDPPYKHKVLTEILAIIHDNQLLAEDGFVVCEYKQGEEMLESVGTLRKMKDERYNETAITIYKAVNDG